MEAEMEEVVAEREETMVMVTQTVTTMEDRVAMEEGTEGETRMGAGMEMEWGRKMEMGEVKEIEMARETGMERVAPTAEVP